MNFKQTLSNLFLGICLVNLTAVRADDIAQYLFIEEGGFGLVPGVGAQPAKASQKDAETVFNALNVVPDKDGRKLVGVEVFPELLQGLACTTTFCAIRGVVPAMENLT